MGRDCGYWHAGVRGRASTLFSDACLPTTDLGIALRCWGNTDRGTFLADHSFHDAVTCACLVLLCPATRGCAGRSRRLAMRRQTRRLCGVRTSTLDGLAATAAVTCARLLDGRVATVVPEVGRARRHRARWCRGPVGRVFREGRGCQVWCLFCGAAAGWCACTPRQSCPTS